ncbi:pilus assembly protein PilP [Alteromonas aestuariivivens]|uniref:pilus assembly protein PilP n=1 Tax=Alteromonas aestuariivivens TaxID=1938339 RepID=UPI0015F271DB|nr:pilus assembly protein PilP [Alteromonas aestuariivivens]
MKRLPLAAIVMATLSGCSPQLDDLVAYTEEVKSTTRVNIEPYPEFAPQPAFEYSAKDLRSPFVRPRDQSAPIVVAQQANCLQPDLNRRKEPLENYGLDALNLTGNFKSQGRQFALFKTNDGNLHKVSIGNRVGLFYGKVKSISGQSVTIEQLLPDGAGCWQRKETTLTMSSAAGDEENV